MKSHTKAHCPGGVYHKRRNPSGCDKFWCLHRYRPVYYYWLMLKYKLKGWQ